MKHYWPCIDLIKHVRLHKMSALHVWSAITFLLPVNLQMISLSLKNTKLLLFTDLSGTVQQYTILLLFGSISRSKFCWRMCRYFNLRLLFLGHLRCFSLFFITLICTSRGKKGPMRPQQLISHE